MMAKHTPGPTQLSGLRIFISYPRGGYTHTWAEKVHADLEARGAVVWRDEHSIAEGSDDWVEQIRSGLERAYVVVSVVGQDSDTCKWQQREMLYADRIALPCVAFRNSHDDMPLYMIDAQAVELRDASAPAASFETLAAAVLRADAGRAAPSQSAIPPTDIDPQQHDRECAYLRGLLDGALSSHEARYAPVSGQERPEPSFARTHKGLRQEQTSILKLFKQETLPAAVAPIECADVLEVYRGLASRPVRRLAVLGEPGAGKSFSLERFACDFARRALADPAAPIPLLVPLGLWTRERDEITAFIEAQLGALGRHFSALRAQRRAVLLLDGLNEIPPQQRQLKASQIRTLAEDEGFAAVIISCRERDFTDDYRLPFDTLTIQPLTPIQIERFLHRGYSLQQGDPSAGALLAEERFWHIAGGAELRAVWQTWQDHGATFEQFWSVEDLNQQLPAVYANTSGDQDACWRAARHDPRS